MCARVWIICTQAFPTLRRRNRHAGEETISLSHQRKTRHALPCCEKRASRVLKCALLRHRSAFGWAISARASQKRRRTVRVSAPFKQEASTLTPDGLDGRVSETIGKRKKGGYAC